MQKHMPKLGVGLILGLCVLVGVISVAEAVINIGTAEVQNGVAFIKGNGAALGAQITWEGAVVTTANTNNGGFSFFGVLPADCRGELSDMAETVLVDVLNCTPDADGAPAPVAVTGQTTSFAGGDDGDIEAGVRFPSPRFTDNLDGTVTDNLTGLIWLKNANCFGGQTWVNALSAANTLQDTGTPETTDDCGLSDGSVVGDWLLPNVKELQSLVDFGFISPALSNTAGTAKWTEGDAFSGVRLTGYWSSTTLAGGPDVAWFVNLNGGAQGPPCRGQHQDVVHVPHRAEPEWRQCWQISAPSDAAPTSRMR